MQLTDYHVHTTLCHHASGTASEYVEQAHALGLSEIGFACHSPTEHYLDDWRMAAEDLPRYFEMVEEARARGAELGVAVRLGLEVDYLEGHERWIEHLAGLAEWDYLIGSVHYLTSDLVVDHPDHLSRLRALDPDEVWGRYWRLFAQAARTGLFDFMAHPDLPKKFGLLPTGDPRRFYEPALEAMREAKVAFEINTGGLRKDIRQAYPASEFLRLANAADIPLAINSDAHQPEEVGFAFAEATRLARAAGYTATLRFKKRRRSLAALAEAEAG